MMPGPPDPRILIFGNSGAGKSTLAQHLAALERLEHLDLDDLAWASADPPIRREPRDSARDIGRFMDEHPGWIIEGCYADLLAVAARRCTRMIFLNPGIEACIENCRARPWEPHKYASAEEQNASLEMLIDWVRQYETRDDVFSLASHRRLFDGFSGDKIEHRSNVDLSRISSGDAGAR